jgi:diguanylate cyclase (GGDEF)-like protein
VLLLVYGTSADVRAGQMWTVLLVPIYGGAFRDDLRGAFASGVGSILGLLTIVFLHDPAWLEPGGGLALAFILAVLACLTLLTGLPARGTNRRIQAMREAKAALSYQVHHDALTGLANRTRLHDFARQAMADRRELAVLALDLDGFKQVNDTLGHAAGDELLKVVAARLLAQARDDDIVARLGGDEFAIVLAASSEVGGARAVLQRCLAEIERPIEVAGGHRVTVSASIGIVLARGACETAAILRGADDAMYAAKRAGKGRIQIGSTLTSADACMLTPLAAVAAAPAARPFRVA